MFKATNLFLQKAMPALAPLSLVLGLLFCENLASYAWLIPWLFALMTFSAGLALKIDELRRLMTKPIFLIVNIGILHLFIPVCVWLVSQLFYQNEHIITGFVIIALTPVGTSSLIWVAFYRGNVSLALAVIVADTLLIPFCLPFMLYLLMRSHIAMNSWQIMGSLFWMVLLPSLVATGLNRLTHGKAAQKLSLGLSFGSKCGILLLLLINGGVAAPYFHDFNWQLLGIVLFDFCICCFGYIVSFVVGKRLFEKKGDIIAFMLCGGIRNVGAGAAIALLYFPPLTCLTVVVGMMFQQILGYNAGRIADSRLPETLPA